MLLDRGRKGVVSRASDRESLLEVRANAFAAAFLMPPGGVGEFVQGLAKGQPSRLASEVFDGEDALEAQARSTPGSQALQMHDVVLLAHHFGVSRIAALYRLKNLRLVKDPEFQALKAQEDQGFGKTITGLLDLEKPGHEKARNEFRHRFLGLALEAFRRDEITRSKARELCAQVEVEGDLLEDVLARLEAPEPDRTHHDPGPKD